MVSVTLGLIAFTMLLLLTMERIALGRLDRRYSHLGYPPLPRFHVAPKEEE